MEGWLSGRKQRFAKPLTVLIGGSRVRIPPLPYMKPLLSWQAPEFTKHKKGPIWFIVFAIISLGLLFLALQWKAFTMAILLILTIFLIIIYALKDPPLRHFSITASGIKIDKSLYKFSDIVSFWIFYDPPEIKEISFKQRKLIFPYLSTPLDNIDPNKVRKVLLRFLSEKKQKESIPDNIARILRF